MHCPVATPPPLHPLLKRNAVIATIVYTCVHSLGHASSHKSRTAQCFLHTIRKILVSFLFKVYVISSQSVRSDYLLE